MISATRTRTALIGLGSAIVSLLIVSAGGPGANAAVRVVCDGTWKVQASPHPGSGSSLSGVAALTFDDAWAVGPRTSKRGQSPLIEHWDGLTWSVVHSPRGSGSARLDAVAALSDSDVWAVGAQDALGHSLTEHWDGSSWSIVRTPSSGTLNRLLGVAAIAPADVWAVGLGPSQQGGELPLSLHWDGSTWTSVATAPLPPNDGIAQFSAVSAIAQDDVWAVGFYGNTSGGTTTLAEHWDGTSWSIVSTPSPTIHATLSGVSAISADRALAIGERDLYPHDKVLAERWNGTGWRRVPAEDATQPNDLVSVSVTVDRVGWSVGSSGTGTLIERLDAGGWTVVPSPSVPGTASLAGVSTLTSGAAWAVGTETQSGATRTLTEFVCP
jgi:hypothetical protein